MRNSTNGYKKYEQYNKRNKGNIIDLYNFDKTNATWEPFVEYYAKKFNVTEPAVLFDEEEPQSNKHI